MDFAFLFDTQRENYVLSIYKESECYRFYAQVRKSYCNFLQIMDLWLSVPYCKHCAFDRVFPIKEDSTIDPSGWEIDVLIHLGPNALEYLQKGIEESEEFSIPCKRCDSELRPWDKDIVYVDEIHLEEHYGIPLETGNRIQPERKLSNQIKRLYGEECFNCLKKGMNILTIDHIRPQKIGGDSAFRNLQPLCVECGNLKGDQIPEEIQVHSWMYFTSPPSETYEHMFW